MSHLRDRIKKLDEKIAEVAQQIFGSEIPCSRLEQLLRDRGELYGYIRLLDRARINQETHSNISGRVLHLERCNGLAGGAA